MITIFIFGVFCPFKDTEYTSEALACSSLVEDPTKLLMNYLPDS